VGDTLRRVIEKGVLALAPTKELTRSMLPLQTGLSGYAMCEQEALSLHASFAFDLYHGKWCVLQVDIKNAFNSVHRSSILEAVGRQVDEGQTEIAGKEVAISMTLCKWSSRESPRVWSTAA
jgi:hypothetical protein